MPARTDERYARILGAPVLDIPYPTEVRAADGSKSKSAPKRSKSAPSPKLLSTTKTLLGGLDPAEEDQRPTTPNCPASIRFAANGTGLSAPVGTIGSTAARPPATLLGVGPMPSELPATNMDDVAGAHVARPQATLLGVGPDRLLAPAFRGPVAPSPRPNGDHRTEGPTLNPTPSDLRAAIPLTSTWPALVLVAAGLLAFALGVAYTF